MDTQHGPFHQAATFLKGQTAPLSGSVDYILFTALHPAGEDKFPAKGWLGANTGKIHSSHELFFIFFPQPFKPVRKDAFLWVVCDELWLFWLWGYCPKKRVLRTWSHLLGSHHCWHGVAPSYFTASNANLTTDTLSQRRVSGQQRYRKLHGCVACLKHSPRSLQQMDNSSSPAALRFCLSSREDSFFGL